MRNTTLNLFTGPTRFITLKEFVRLLPKRPIELDQSTWQFNKQIGYEDFFTVDGVPSSESTYITHLVDLYPGAAETIVLEDLVRQAITTHLSKKPLIELVQHACVSHAEQMGSAEYFVRLAPRVWIVVNLSDFRLIYNNTGAALACYNKARTEVLVVGK